ncbi:MAG TPA: hypothetical protein VGM77_10120 [Gemmatimonadales bacterium]
MAARARDFIQAHPVDDPSFATVAARLSDAVGRADVLVRQELDGHTTERAAASRRDTLRRTIRHTALRRLVRIAGLAAETHPELVGQFSMPPRDGPKKIFILAAQAMLDAALPIKDVLIPLGLGATFFDDLAASIASYDAATASSHAGRGDHIGARAELNAVALECMRDVAVLDTFVRTAYADDAELLAIWTAASNVVGPYHRAPADPAPVPAPVITPVVDPVSQAA